MDQFYTKPEISEKCMNILKNKINLDEYDIMFEPSGGTGSFFNLFDKTKRVGIDLEPKCENIKQMNLFEYKPIENKKYITIGNPPFGRVCSTAIKFFNYCAEFSDIIAFIIPRTFKRVSVQNRIDKYFHLVYNEDLPIIPCCFEPYMNAKCCFQIWIKKKEQRKKIIYKTTCDDFEFIKLGSLDDKNQPTVPLGSDFALKAYGSNCGKIEFDTKTLRPKSWHWIKSKIPIDVLVDRFNGINYNISKDTVRQDSIGRGELVHLYIQSLI